MAVSWWIPPVGMEGWEMSGNGKAERSGGNQSSLWLDAVVSAALKLREAHKLESGEVEADMAFQEAVHAALDHGAELQTLLDVCCWGNSNPFRGLSTRNHLTN